MDKQPNSETNMDLSYREALAEVERLREREARVIALLEKVEKGGWEDVSTDLVRNALEGRSE